MAPPLSSSAAICVQEMKFLLGGGEGGVRRTSMSARVQFDEHKDDDEGGALRVLSALSLGPLA